MLFVSHLNEETRRALWILVRSATSSRQRERAHAVLLSDKRHSLHHIAEIFERDRDTVSAWLKGWEEKAFDGLDDAARSGRPRITTAKEDRRIIAAVKRHPQQIRQAQARLKKKPCAEHFSDTRTLETGSLPFQTYCQTPRAKCRRRGISTFTTAFGTIEQTRETRKDSTLVCRRFRIHALDRPTLRMATCREASADSGTRTSTTLECHGFFQYS